MFTSFNARAVGLTLSASETLRLAAKYGFGGVDLLVRDALDDGVRALIIGRADEERVCELADSLRGVHLRSGDTMRLDPRTNMLLEKLPRIPDENHEMNWVDAAKGKTPAACPFEYASRLTEVMLLGVVALKAGRKIEYDAANMRITNVPSANQHLERAPRAGWSL